MSPAAGRRRRRHPPPIGIEQLNDQMVAQRRDRTPSRALQFLRDQLASGLDTFAGLQQEPLASTLAPMLDLGSYPLHAIADMFTFDHHSPALRHPRPLRADPAASPALG